MNTMVTKQRDLLPEQRVKPIWDVYGNGPYVKLQDYVEQIQKLNARIEELEYQAQSGYYIPDYK